MSEDESAGSPRKERANPPRDGRSRPARDKTAGTKAAAGKKRPQRKKRPRRRRLHVVAAVIERGENILVSLRKAKHRRPSQWEFPGGKIEKGETERQALKREIREELGVECVVGDLVRRHVHNYPNAAIEIAFYATTITEGEPRPLEMREIRWVAKCDLGDLDFLTADIPFVKDLVRSVRKKPAETRDEEPAGAPAEPEG